MTNLKILFFHFYARNKGLFLFGERPTRGFAGMKGQKSDVKKASDKIPANFNGVYYENLS